MALRYWAYIYLSPGFDPIRNTTESHSNLCRFKSVGLDFSQKELVIEIARNLVKEGVQMIELCGGFGPIWVARVSDAIQGVVPVGSTAYGPEARRPMLEILA